jgi:nicotinic acid phosphoribosyltransferase
MSIYQDNEYYKLMKNSTLPESVIDLILFFIGYAKDEVIEILNSEKDDYLYSLNDTFMYQHSNHEKFGAIIEICCPYAKREFAMVEYDEFLALIKNLIDHKEIGVIKSLSIDEKDRMDYLESLENW